MNNSSREIDGLGPQGYMKRFPSASRFSWPRVSCYMWSAGCKVRERGHHQWIMGDFPLPGLFSGGYGSCWYCSRLISIQVLISKYTKEMNMIECFLIISRRWTNRIYTHCLNTFGSTFEPFHQSSQLCLINSYCLKPPQTKRLTILVLPDNSLTMPAPVKCRCVNRQYYPSNSYGCSSTTLVTQHG